MQQIPRSGGEQRKDRLDIWVWFSGVRKLSKLSDPLFCVTEPRGMPVF